MHIFVSSKGLKFFTPVAVSLFFRTTEGAQIIYFFPELICLLHDREGAAFINCGYK